MHRPAIKSVLFVLGLLALTACTRHQKTVPTELQGYWTTDAAGYETRYLEMDDNYVLVGVNEFDLPDLQRVSRVESQTDGVQKVFTIYSSNSESEYQLTLRYDPANDGTLRVKNRDGVLWKRAKI